MHGELLYLFQWVCTWLARGSKKHEGQDGVIMNNSMLSRLGSLPPKKSSARGGLTAMLVAPYGKLRIYSRSPPYGPVPVPGLNLFRASTPALKLFVDMRRCLLAQSAFGVALFSTCATATTRIYSPCLSISPLLPTIERRHNGATDN